MFDVLENKIEEFITSQRSDNTRRAYRQDLRAWEAFLDGREPNIGLVIEFRDDLEENMSNSSALRRFNTIRTYFRWAEVSPNPFERVKAPRRVSDWSPIIPDEANISKVLQLCDNPTDSAIMALLNNGLRAQEVCDLQAADFYFEPTYNTHILRVTGKGMKMRLVPANSETVEALSHIKIPFRHLNIRKVYYIVKKWSEKAGIGDLHPHALRHGYATRLVRAGVPVFSLQRLLGHSRPETTGIYVNLDLTDLIGAARLDPRHIEVRNVTPVALIGDN